MNNDVVIFENKKLKQELKHLEKTYQSLSLKRDEMINKITEFNNEYNLKFGGLLNKILSLKEENVYKKIELRKLKKEKLLKSDEILKKLRDKHYKLELRVAQIELEIKKGAESDILKEELVKVKSELEEVEENINFIENEKKISEIEFKTVTDEELNYQFQEAKEEKEEFNKEYKESEKVHKLNESEFQELKKIYKLASKLIHPDIVTEEFKKEASDLMAKLNEIYHLKDLKQIKEFYENIKNKNIIFVSDILDDKDTIQKQIYLMKDKIVEVTKEIHELETNEVFEIIDNKEEYFNEVQKSLEHRLSDLKIEKSHLKIAMLRIENL
jgi:hypothetical protein